MAEFQPTQFQPVEFYDLPTLAFSQIVNGQASIEGFRSLIAETTGVGSGTLTPSERTSLVDKYKKDIQADGLSGALIDVATNPWVWLSFLATPSAVTAVRGGARAARAAAEGTKAEGVFDVTSKYHAYVRETAPKLLGWGWMTGNQLLMRTPLRHAIAEATKGRLEIQALFEETVGAAEKEVIKAFRKEGIKINSLDWRKAPREHRERIRLAQAALHARISGMDIKGGVDAWKVLPSVRGNEYTFTKQIRVLDDDGRPIADKFEYDTITINARDFEEAKQKLNAVRDDAEDFDRSLKKPEDFKEGDVDTSVQVKEVKDQVQVGYENYIRRGVVNSGKVDDVLIENHMVELANAHRNYYDQMALKMFLREDLVRPDQVRSLLENNRLDDLRLSDLVDENKVINLWRSGVLRADKKDAIPLFGSGSRDHPGIRFMQDIMEDYRMHGMGPDEAARVTSERLAEMQRNPDKIRGIVAANMTGGYYTPKFFDQIDETGQRLSDRARAARTKEETQAIAAGQTMARMNTETPWTFAQDDIDILRLMKTDEVRPELKLEGEEGIEKWKELNQEFLENEAVLNGYQKKLQDGVASIAGKPRGERAMSVNRLDPWQAVRFYNQQNSNSYSLFIRGAMRTRDGRISYNQGLWEPYRRSQRDTQRFYDEAGEKGEDFIYHSSVSNARARDVLTDDVFNPNQGGYFNVADMINQGYVSIRDEGLRGVLRDAIVPNMMGRSNIHHTTENMLAHVVRSGARQTAKMLNTIGVHKTEYGKKLIDEMTDFADRERAYMGSGTGGGIAKYLYTTHLGLNPAAVVLNASQPWLIGGSLMGVGNIAKGYMGAFKELSGYLAARAASGKIIISQEEKAKMIKEHFKYADEAGISPDTFRNIDDPAYGKGLANEKSAWDHGQDLMMKGFEKGEWLNRLVMTHAMENAYKGAGKLAGEGAMRAQMLDDMSRMVQETQFGADVLNTPMHFLGYGGGLGQILGRPEMRQFLTFPLRSLSGLFVTPKQVGAGRRQIFGHDYTEGNGIFPIAHDFVRGMGISSALYYTGRNMFDADLSKGLFWQSSTDLIGGDPFNDYETPWDMVPVPPAVDLIWGAGKGLLGADLDLMAHSAWRAVPGGIGLSRAVSSMPAGMGMGRENPLGRLAEKFQRRYVAWDKKGPNGLVPIFKGDGTFVEYQDPAKIILGSFGLDLGKTKVASEGTGYLTKQRQEILGARHQFINRLLANDISGATSVKESFERRFKFPLTVSKTQLRAFMRNRATPRNERILDRIPKEGRRLYAEMVAKDAVREGVDPQAFVDARTTSDRRELMNRQGMFDLNPESIQVMREMFKEAESLDNMGFKNYESFGS